MEHDGAPHRAQPVWAAFAGVVTGVLPECCSIPERVPGTVQCAQHRALAIPRFLGTKET